MSNLRLADELCEAPPRFTGEERRRISEYEPPDGHEAFVGQPVTAPGQSYHEINRRRREYMADWRERLRQLERSA